MKIEVKRSAMRITPNLLVFRKQKSPHPEAQELVEPGTSKMCNASPESEVRPSTSTETPMDLCISDMPDVLEPKEANTPFTDSMQRLKEVWAVIFRTFLRLLGPKNVRKFERWKFGKIKFFKISKFKFPNKKQA